MLQFTDLNHTQHIINISNVNNVVIRNNNGAHVITFHMPGQHVVPATVDVKTAERIFKELGELKSKVNLLQSSTHTRCLCCVTCLQWSHLKMWLKTT